MSGIDNGVFCFLSGFAWSILEIAVELASTL